MLSHTEIWAAIDGLADRVGLSPSGLAKLAGLDPTAFNPSKRFSSDGTKPRWPSTESVAKALFAARVSFSDFAALATDQSTGRPVPLIGFAQAGNDGYFDDAGFPAGHGWDEIHFPGVSDHNAYALEIAGDSMAPVYRESDRIIVEPKAPIRRGDRVVVKTHQGGVLAKELGRTTAKKIELISLNKNYEDRTIQTSDVVWIGRIAWASQ